MSKDQTALLGLAFGIGAILLTSCAGGGGAQDFSYAAQPTTQYAAPVQPIVAPVRPMVVRPQEQAPYVRAGSVMIIDAVTGEELHSVNSRQKRAVASTQKLLTALLVVEAGNLQQRVTIAPSDTYVEPTKLGFSAGQSYTRMQLLNALLVKSCNDAAAALGRDNAGSVAAFAAKMNYRARQLGAYESNFLNPHGLTESGQYSTARDISRIAFYARRNPIIRQIVQQDYYNFPMASGGSRYLASTNKLMKRVGYCDGLKTGYTMASGRCLVTSGSYNGRSAIIVQLGSRESYIWEDAGKLLVWAVEK
jgi:serine-type D-Ala-D-Ala carboxypeptidase (penicillin-binding protein 5/6)